MTEETTKIAEAAEKKQTSWIQNVPGKAWVIAGISIIAVWVMGFSQGIKIMITALILGILIIMGRRVDESYKEVTFKESVAITDADIQWRKSVGLLAPFVDYEILPYGIRAYAGDKIRYVYGGVNFHYPWGEVDYCEFNVFMNRDGYIKKAMYGEVDGNYKPWVYIPALYKKLMKGVTSSQWKKFME